MHCPYKRRSRRLLKTQRKSDRIFREVYALTVGLPPLTPAIDTYQLKGKVQSENEKVRIVNGVPPTGGYSFAKYSKSVDVIKYTDEEYEKNLTDLATKRNY